MTSYIQKGSVNIILEFNAGFDSDKALIDVRNKVSDTSYKLPKDLSLEPVLNIIITGNIYERSLVTLARNLKDDIEDADGVLEVVIGGERYY